MTDNCCMKYVKKILKKSNVNSVRKTITPYNILQQSLVFFNVAL